MKVHQTNVYLPNNEQSGKAGELRAKFKKIFYFNKHSHNEISKVKHLIVQRNVYLILYLQCNSS